jgi:hypothetical protein
LAEQKEILGDNKNFVDSLFYLLSFYFLGLWINDFIPVYDWLAIYLS